MKKTKSTRQPTYLTIPELKQAFDYIESFAKDRPSLKEFQEEWKKVFNRPIMAEHAKAYLEFTVKNAATGTRKLRKYRGRGGAEVPGVFAGQGLLPGDVTADGLRPYGIFQKYVSDGFEIGIPQMSSQVMCEKGIVGPQGPLPSAPLVGGAAAASQKRKRTIRKVRGGRFPQSMNPTSLLQDIATAWRGETMPASPSPLDNPYLK
jgi:hypothetical protein